LKKKAAGENPKHTPRPPNNFGDVMNQNDSINTSSKTKTTSGSLNARVLSLIYSYVEDRDGHYKVYRYKLRKDLILTGLVPLGSGRDRRIISDLVAIGVLGATASREVYVIDPQALTAAVSSMDPHPEASA